MSNLSEDQKIYEKLDGNAKGLYILLKHYLDEKFEEVTTNQATLEAFITTITNDETFQSIIGKSLEKAEKKDG